MQTTQETETLRVSLLPKELELLQFVSAASKCLKVVSPEALLKEISAMTIVAICARVGVPLDNATVKGVGDELIITPMQ
jgi:hypothetical protein